jgi:GntR family galactonate operon transcriptional repressor
MAEPVSKRTRDQRVRAATDTVPGGTPDPGGGIGTGITGYRLKGIHGRVIGSLGESIVRGLYPPGSILPREPELMTIYQASRTTIREAIKVLSAKGLVESRQRIGTWVSERSHWNIFDSDVLHWHAFDDIDDSMLKDLIEMRQVVEPPMARFAAIRATLDDIALIGERCEDMRRSMHDMEAYATADVRFHLAVFHASHNAMLRRFAHIVADFLQISFQIQQRALDSRGNRIKDDYAQHLKLYQAINRSDAAAAEAIMMDVIMDGKASLLRARRLPGN